MNEPMEATEVKKEKKPRENPDLQKQGNALKRFIKNSDFTVVEIAKRCDVDRQSIYMWQRGIAAIPEDKLKILADIFKVDPAEIRYDITMFNHDDLAFLVEFVEEQLAEYDEKLNPKVKAKLVTALYEALQNDRRALNVAFSRDKFIKAALPMIKMAMSLS